MNARDSLTECETYYMELIYPEFLRFKDRVAVPYTALYASVCLAARAGDCKSLTKKHRWFESIPAHQVLESHNAGTLMNRRERTVLRNRARKVTISSIQGAIGLV